MFAAAVDEDGELHFSWAAKIHQLIHGGPDSAAGVKNIIHDYDNLVLDVVFEFGPIYYWVRSDGRQIVTVKRDVENSV